MLITHVSEDSRTILGCAGVHQCIAMGQWLISECRIEENADETFSVVKRFLQGCIGMGQWLINYWVQFADETFPSWGFWATIVKTKISALGQWLITGCWLLEQLAQQIKLSSILQPLLKLPEDSTETPSNECWMTGKECWWDWLFAQEQNLKHSLSS